MSIWTGETWEGESGLNQEIKTLRMGVNGLGWSKSQADIGTGVAYNRHASQPKIKDCQRSVAVTNTNPISMKLTTTTRTSNYSININLITGLIWNIGKIGTDTDLQGALFWGRGLVWKTNKWVRFELGILYIQGRVIVDEIVNKPNYIPSFQWNMPTASLLSSEPLL